MPRHPPCALISLTFQGLGVRSQGQNPLAPAFLFLAPVDVSFANSRIMLLSLEVCLNKIVVSYPDYFHSQSIFETFVFYLIALLSLFSFQDSIGGHKWTRTIDLTLIRRAL